MPFDPALLAGFDLVGCRDRCDVRALHPHGYHIPCVSCQHPALDERHEPIDDLRVYEHLAFPIPEFADVPRRTNRVSDGDAVDAIRFIAGAKTLVTNSYHGAYWGALLGRPVYVYRPFSTKFRNMPGTQIIQTADEREPVAVVPNYLADCRGANDRFYQGFNFFRATH